ncbi:hypothetical protein [Ktedonospora formicarum]|uniref:hypothetical protein n=1 Tax=Ktedonospora formicarum TaxID=2778364 RepID=UPI001C693C42|nr:hypothetical protein [Ktedonospora formicarum]
MPKRYSRKKTHDEHQVVEERLRAFYGPALPEQPLPLSSWQRLSSHLPPRPPQRRWTRSLWHFSRRQTRQALPFEMQTTLSRLAAQMDMPYAAQNIQCRVLPRVHVPFVSVSLFKKPAICLSLPAQRIHSLSQAERDLLLASGFARSIYVRRATYRATRLVLSTLACVSILASGLMLVFWHSVSFLLALFLLACFWVSTIVCFWLLGHHARQIAFRADRLMAEWIGREQACRGLHALAARSRTPSRAPWGELSLNERIAAICHSSVAAEDEHVTLVR